MKTIHANLLRLRSIEFFSLILCSNLLLSSRFSINTSHVLCLGSINKSDQCVYNLFFGKLLLLCFIVKNQPITESVFSVSLFHHLFLQQPFHYHLTSSTLSHVAPSHISSPPTLHSDTSYGSVRFVTSNFYYQVIFLVPRAIVTC